MARRCWADPIGYCQSWVGSGLFGIAVRMGRLDLRGRWSLSHPRCWRFGMGWVRPIMHDDVMVMYELYV